MRSRATQSARVLAAFARNRDLRFVGIAFAGFIAAEWGVWIAMLVYAYDHGGATTAGVVAVVQLVPAALFAPVAASLADRHRPATVLALGYLLQAAAMGATAVALLATAPPVVAYAFAAVAASAVTITRPAQSVLVPGLAHRPDDLTGANVALGWIESVSMLAGPALAGILLGAGGAGTAFAVMAAVALSSALLTARLGGPPASRGDEERPATAAFADIAAGIRLLRRQPESRLLVGLMGSQFVVIGALDVLFVVLAVGVLGLGDSGAGYLNAAFGAGGVLGIVVTAALVGRSRLAPALVAGIGVWGLAVAGIGLEPSTAAAFTLLVAAGVGRTVFDVASRTLLQRTAPGEVLGRVFGVLEGLSMAGLAAGSLMVSALVALGGPDAAFFGAGALLPLLALASRRRLTRIDASADVPVVELSLLRAVPVTAALPAPELEQLARRLLPLTIPEGGLVFAEGDSGDLFYVVASGQLEVLKDGRRVAQLARGDTFGEIALLEDRPRTASIRACCAAVVYTLAREDFLAAVAGNHRFGQDARRLASSRRDSSARLVASGKATS